VAVSNASKIVQMLGRCGFYEVEESPDTGMVLAHEDNPSVQVQLYTSKWGKACWAYYEPRTGKRRGKSHGHTSVREAVRLAWLAEYGTTPSFADYDEIKARVKECRRG